MTLGMKATGEPARMRPRELLIFLGRALHSGWFFVAVPLMALSFYSLLVLLSWQPVTFVIPASALSYVVGTLGAKYILREDVSPARWIGVVLVCAGVALVAAG
jgi:drug/metabolite transporter (DMT)-like permease